MTHYLLDTNIAIKAVKRKEPILLANIARAIDRYDILSMSVISVFELKVGALRNSNPETAFQKNEKFMSLIKNIMIFEPADAEIAAKIRARHLDNGATIGSLDALIAGQAIRLGLPLVTNNVEEFSHVPNLEIHDWTKP
jgi:tRNA(fMet)-specific endonuclease VapC